MFEKKRNSENIEAAATRTKTDFKKRGMAHADAGVVMGTSLLTSIVHGP